MFYHLSHNHFSLLLFQIILIVSCAHLMGFLFKKISQPFVIGEIIAGILLGPSFLGEVLPQFQELIFPPASVNILKLLSQVGIILFMFMVGLQLDTQTLKSKARSAFIVSQTSIFLPFVLGVILSYFISDTFSSPNGTFLPFALFMGIAMSITAFPVLARILEDRGLSKTPIGIMAITCAAVDDVSAWSLLAIVLAFVRTGNFMEGLITLFFTFLFVVFMLLVVKRWLQKFSGSKVNWDQPNHGLLFLCLLFVFLSALCAERIGIHAIFGAFLAGLSLSHVGPLRFFIRDKIEFFSSTFLLPLFFAVTGLRTQIHLIDSWSNGLLCLTIILLATVGKMGGTSLAAKFTGMNWRDALSLGALMNTRGLVELIVLNIGYDFGIISQKLFSMMVIMALVTTFMTSPLLSLISSFRKHY